MGEGFSLSHFLSLWPKDQTANRCSSDQCASPNQTTTALKISIQSLEFEICIFFISSQSQSHLPTSPSLKHTNTCTVNTDALLNFQNEDIGRNAEPQNSTTLSLILKTDLFNKKTKITSKKTGTQQAVKGV